MPAEFLILILIGFNIFIFFLPYIKQFGDGFMSSNDYFMTLGWKDNAAIKNGEYYRLLTSSFIHSGGMHLFFNMYSLFLVGPFVLHGYGALPFLLIYLLSAVGGSLVSFFFNPNPSVGASGSLFGLIGSILVFAVSNQQLSILANIFFIIVLNVVIGFLPGSRIDNWGHLGGFLTGSLVALLYWFLPLGF